MSHIRKQIKVVRRQIEALDSAMKGAATLSEWQDLNAAELHQRDILEDDLKVLEAMELEEQARPFGIDIFPSGRGWGDPDLWESSRNGRAKVLTDEGRIRAKNLIIEARFNYWKRWVDVVAPIASTIISIIALIVAIIALNR